MNYKQKMADYSHEFSGQLQKDGNQELDSKVYVSILAAMSDDHAGCVCYHMPLHVKSYLEQEGFLVVHESEDDNAYWIVSWGEQIIA